MASGSRSRLLTVLNAAGLIHSSASGHLGISPSTEFYRPSAIEGSLAHTDSYDYGNETYWIDTKKSKYAGGSGAKYGVTETQTDKPRKEKATGRRQSVESYVDRHGHGAVGGAEIDFSRTKAVLRKVDTRLLPMLFMLFFLAELDRANISFAAQLGSMRDDLGLGDDGDRKKLDLAQGIFYIPLVIFALPYNFLLRLLSPSTLLSVLVAFWGIVTIGQGFVKTSGQLIACRFLVGFFEAGFLPASVYLLSAYYSKWRLQKRLAWTFCGALLAAAVGGEFAHAIASGLDSRHNLAGWRWVMVIEGVITVAACIATKLFLPDFPELAKFLSEQERSIITVSVSHDAPTRAQESGPSVSGVVTHAYGSWKIVCSAFMILGAATAITALTTALPTVLSTGLDFGDGGALSHAIYPYLVAIALTLLTSYLADALRTRFAPLFFTWALAFTGFVVLSCSHKIDSHAVRYMSVFLAVAGSWSLLVTTLAWMVGCVVATGRGGLAIGTAVGIGSLGGLVGSFLFMKGEFGDGSFTAGFCVTFGLLCISLICGIVLSATGGLESLWRRHRRS